MHALHKIHIIFSWNLYLQISHFEGPDLLFGLHFPNLNHAAHIARGHQGGVVAEHSARHRVFVACGGKK